MIALHLEGIKKNLRGRAALDGISGRLTAATLHGLIGPDGAGKTTLLRVLAGLLVPTSGGFAFIEETRKLDGMERRARLAYMPQTQSLYPDLSIEEHLEFFRDLRGVPDEKYRQKKERLLRMTGLTNFVDRPAGKLSGGMYKKLGLMCALLGSPDVLLLDEPTNGVDPVSRREFWQMIYDLRSGGMTVVLATSYMDEAERCDVTWVLNDGRLVASGPPQDILASSGATGFNDYFRRAFP